MRHLLVLAALGASGRGDRPAKRAASSARAVSRLDARRAAPRAGNERSIDGTIVDTNGETVTGKTQPRRPLGADDSRSPERAAASGGRSPSTARARARASSRRAATAPSSTGCTMRSTRSARPSPPSRSSISRTPPRQDYDRLADTIDREFGKLDGLVHAAALLGDRTPLEQYDVPTWCRVLHVNLTAPFILTQVLLPNLRKSPDASVIFVSASVARKPRAYWGAYAVSKAGLEAVRGNAHPGARGQRDHPRQQRQSRAACARRCARRPIRRKIRTRLPVPRR